jgi:GNAT superfamily N-acetyltransferase
MTQPAVPMADLEQRRAALREECEALAAVAGGLLARIQALRLELAVPVREPVAHPPVRAVRPATLEDALEVQRMALALLRSSAYTGRLSPNLEHLFATILWVIGQGCFVAETEDGLVGVIGVAVIVSPLTGERTGAEAIWWVDPPYRHGRTALRLWERAEAWARDQAAVLMHMIAPAGQDDVSALYARRGYVPLETTWQRRLDEDHGGQAWAHP